MVSLKKSNIEPCDKFVDDYHDAVCLLLRSWECLYLLTRIYAVLTRSVSSSSPTAWLLPPAESHIPSSANNKAIALSRISNSCGAERSHLECPPSMSCSLVYSVTYSQSGHFQCKYKSSPRTTYVCTSTASSPSPGRK